MQILLLRHAQTDYNEQELINGQLDEPLSKIGKSQLPALVTLTQAEEFDVIHSSPLVRAAETAGAIATKHQLPVNTDARLIEVDVGSFSGKPWDATIADFGVTSSKLLSSGQYDFTDYGGESADQVRARVRDFIAELQNHPEQKPLIICHGGIIRMFHELCTGKNAGRIAHGEVFRFTI